MNIFEKIPNLGGEDIEKKSLSKEEVSNALKESGLIKKFRESISMDTIKEVANQVYNNREGKSKQKIVDEFEEGLKNKVEETESENNENETEEKKDDVLERFKKSGGLEIYYDFTEEEIKERITRICEENKDDDPNILVDKLKKNLIKEEREDLLKRFGLKSFLDGYLKDIAKNLTKEQLESIREEVVEQLLRDRNENLYHPAKAKVNEDVLKKELYQLLEDQVNKIQSRRAS